MTSQYRTSKKRSRNISSDEEDLDPKINLSPQQQQLIATIEMGKSVFITESAGTGKSFLLQHAVSTLRNIHPPNSIFVTASTGVAACALGGQTLYSFAGVGLGKGTKKELMSFVLKSNKAVERWKKAKALVIDEISMIDGELFDNMEFLASMIRNSQFNQDKPLLWGGIQLIVSGDFFQLPPINAPNPRNEFAFESACWESTFDIQMELTHVYRQSDSSLIEFLEGIRRGQVDCENQIFKKFLNGTTSLNDDSVHEIILFPRTGDVKRVNQDRLKSLGKKVVKFVTADKSSMSWLNQLKYQIAPDELEICEGARVMLIKNTDQAIGLLNDATGVVTGFKCGLLLSSENNPDGVVPIVRFDSGLEVQLESEKWDIIEGTEVMASRRQVPLILAWALSVHKCQGMTLDRLTTDLTRAFRSGMVYVALSRVTTIQGLYVSGFSPEKIKAHPKVLSYYTKLISGYSN